MKKIILLATTLCLLLAVLVGCGNEPAGAVSPVHIPGSYVNVIPNSEWMLTEGMTFRLHQDRQPIGTDGVTIIMENRSDYVMLYGYGFVWERYVNGEWVRLTHRENTAYISIGFTLNDHELKTFFASTSTLQYPLSEGLYRISRWNPIRIAPDDQNLGWDGNFIELPTYKLEFVVCHTASLEPRPIVLERQYWQWYTPWEWYDEMRNEHVMWFTSGANEGRNLVGILYTDCRNFSWYGHSETGSLFMRIFDRATGNMYDIFEQPPVRPDSFGAYEYEGLHGFKLCFGAYQIFATLCSDGLPVYFVIGDNTDNLRSDSNYEVGSVWLVTEGTEFEPGEHFLHGVINTENGLMSGTGIPFEFWLESNWSNLPIWYM